MAHRLMALIWLFVLLGGASAAELTDPTRPPRYYRCARYGGEQRGCGGGS